jgi:hypothetical protein
LGVEINGLIIVLNGLAVFLEIIVGDPTVVVGPGDVLSWLFAGTDSRGAAANAEIQVGGL